MGNSKKRWIAWLLVVVLCITMLPADCVKFAKAEEADPGQTIKEIQIIKQPDITTYYMSEMGSSSMVVSYVNATTREQVKTYRSTEMDLSGMEIKVIYEDAEKPAHIIRWGENEKEEDFSFVNPNRLSDLEKYYAQEAYDMKVDMTYAGKTAQLSFQMLPDQLEEITFVKGPDINWADQGGKEARRLSDLIGAKIKAVMKDGSTETVTIEDTEDTNQGYLTIAGTRRNTAVSSSYNNDKRLRIDLTYQNVKGYYYYDLSDWFTNSAETIQDDDLKSFTWNEEKSSLGYGKLYKFVAPETASYYMSVVSMYTQSPMLYLKALDSNGKKIPITNTYTSRDCKVDLQKGETYYFICYNTEAYSYKVHGAWMVTLSSKTEALNQYYQNISSFTFGENSETLYEGTDLSKQSTDKLFHDQSYSITFPDGKKLEGIVDLDPNAMSIVNYRFVGYYFSTECDEDNKKITYTLKNGDDVVTYERQIETKESPVKSIELILFPQQVGEDYVLYSGLLVRKQMEGVKCRITYDDGTQRTAVLHADGTADLQDPYYKDDSLNQFLISTKKAYYSYNFPAYNTLLINYLGCQLSIPVKMKQTPIQKINILKSPDFTGFNDFNRVIFTNYYAVKAMKGLQFEITQSEDKNLLGVYDIKDEDGKIYKDSVVTDVFYDEYGRISGKKLSLELNGFNFDIPIHYQSAKEVFETGKEIKAGTSAKHYDIDNREVSSFVFYPKETKKYTITLHATEDTYCYIADDQGNRQLIGDDPEYDSGYAGHLKSENNYTQTYEVVMKKGVQYGIVVRANEKKEKKSDVKCSIDVGTNVQDIAEAKITTQVNEESTYSLPTVQVEENPSYQLKNYQWYDVSADREAYMYKTSHAYRLSALLEPKAGYKFTFNTVVTVNGAAAYIKDIDGFGNASVEMYFPAEGEEETTCDVPLYLYKRYGFACTCNYEEYHVDEKDNSYYNYYSIPTTYGEELQLSLNRDQENINEDLQPYVEVKYVKANTWTYSNIILPDTEGIYHIPIKKGYKASIMVYDCDVVSKNLDNINLLLFYMDGDQVLFTEGRYCSNFQPTYGDVATDNIPLYDSTKVFLGWYYKKINGDGTATYYMPESEEPIADEILYLYARWGNADFSYKQDGNTYAFHALNQLKYNDKSLEVQLGNGKELSVIENYGTREITVPSSLTDETQLQKNIGRDIQSANITEIAPKAFYQLQDVDVVYMPSISKIGESAFEESSIQEITVPGTVKTVSQNLCKNSKSLETVVLEEGVQEIKSGAFLGCTNLKTVVIPRSLTSIAEDAFDKDASKIKFIVYDCNKALLDPFVKQGAEVSNAKITFQSEGEDTGFVYFNVEKNVVTVTPYVTVNGERELLDDYSWKYTAKDGCDVQVNKNTKELKITANSYFEPFTMTFSNTDGSQKRELRVQYQPISLKDNCMVSAIPTQKKVQGVTSYTPEVTVTNIKNGSILQKGVDYNVTYQNNDGNSPIAMAVITGLEKYTGTITVSFAIEEEKKVEQKDDSQKQDQSADSKKQDTDDDVKNITVKKAAISKIKVKKPNKIVVTIKKISGVSGYQVCYALNKKFKKAKKKTATKNVITISKLKKKKVYYIKVRAYKKNSVTNKNVYGKWSSVKKKKVTK